MEKESNDSTAKKKEIKIIKRRSNKVASHETQRPVPNLSVSHGNMCIPACGQRARKSCYTLFVKLTRSWLSSRWSTPD
ncbi:hypothetical protein RRG08_051353 [Elysia crispata]|uniref:Uncharacterized protein n=1 Tax=Elysia crispata TaxID=231223 RepID=A0AAE1B3P5_9GAST|nr:hypothetical protein RRG08_051353 [Elysia crispata]